MNSALLDQSMLEMLRWLWASPPSANPAVQARARGLLLDTIGCAIAATAEPEIAGLFRHADPGPVRFPGVPQAISVSSFTGPFATAACWQEACEGLAEAHGRPGLHTIPAVLGAALARSVPLGALLDAIVAGYEVGGRLGIMCRIRPGMHVDGTWGSFGAAAAACHLAGTSPETALAALNHAACHMPFSLYWPITAGSTARNAYAGHGATHGAAAAVASMVGMGGPPGSIAEMLRVALAADLEALPDFPGAGRFLLPEGYLKPYPAVRHVHYGAAAAEAWHATGRAPDAIAAIRLRTYSEGLTYCGNRDPATAIQAQFSLSYGVARSLAHGRLDPAGYTRSALADPLVRRLEKMVELEVSLDRRGGTLEVTTCDQVWTTTVLQVPGDPGTPMTPAQVEAKFLAYTGQVIGDAHAAAIARRVLDGALTAPLHLEPSA